MASPFPQIEQHLLRPDALARVHAVSHLGRDADGWFKGELAYLFDTLVRTGDLMDWRANVPIVEGRAQRCDFRLEVNPSMPQGDPSMPQGGPSIPQGDPSIPQGDRALWLEVKAIPQRAQGGGRVDPGFYLQQGGAGDPSTALRAGITRTS